MELTVLMVHYAPERELRHIRREGILPSRYRPWDRRVEGVYALPLVPGAMAFSSMWKSELQRRKGSVFRCAKVVFRVQSSEPVYWFDDFTENGKNRTLTTARTAAEAFVATANRAQWPFEQWVEFMYPGASKRASIAELDSLREEWLADRNRGWLGFMPEAVIPRRVLAREIL